MCKFFFKDGKSDLEARIVTAIYWIGEAQNEYNRESAFLKFWIGLESILTSNSDRKTNTINEGDKKSGITNTLCKGISVLLSCSGYEFIYSNEMKFTSNRVSKLYDLRSNIVHNGVNKEIGINDLSDICRFSSWSVLCLLWLRNGYNIQSIEEIKSQIDKLYNLQITNVCPVNKA